MLGDKFWRKHHNAIVDDAYKTRWVWYHTLLALELFFTCAAQFVIITILVLILRALTGIAHSLALISDKLG